MKTKIILFLSFLFCFCHLVYGSQGEDSAVSIMGISDTMGETCSGVVIKNDDEQTIVVTAKHCCSDEYTLYVEDNPVIKIYKSKKDDIAVLIVKNKIIDKVPISFYKSNPRFNEALYIVGYPNLIKYESYGTFLYYIGTKYFYINLDIVAGCSGGPVYTVSHELIGIGVASLRYNEHIGVVVPVKRIFNFIDQLITEGKI